MVEAQAPDPLTETPMPLMRVPSLAATCLAVFTLSGCQSKEAPAPAAQPSGATPAPATDGTLLRISAADYSFDAPDQIPAGLTTIRLINTGPSLHHVELIKFDQGKTVADFLTALKAGGPPPSWASMIGGPNVPEFGDSSTAIVTLDPGSYAIVCFIPGTDGVPHLMKGMAHMLTVAGPASSSPEPVADLTAKLTDYDFQFSAPLTAGHHVIRVENDGPQVHEITIVRLQSGKTADDVAKWSEKMMGPPPGAVHGGLSGIMPGEHMYIVIDLPPGQYGLICFFQDMHDGKPHFAHGMIKTITVS